MADVRCLEQLEKVSATGDAYPVEMMGDKFGRPGRIRHYNPLSAVD